MTDHADFLSRLRVASPCPASWNQMQGDERVRHCELCDLKVYNLTELTTTELYELFSRGGRVCGRLYRRPDETVITRDCPVGLRALRKRVARRAGALLGMLLGFSSLGYGQTGSKDQSQKTGVEVSRLTSRENDQQPGLAGTIVDVNGAVIVGATLTLKNLEKKEFSVETDEQGEFGFNVPSGRYTLAVTKPGFQTFILTELNLEQKQLTYFRIKLNVGEILGEIVYELKEIDSPLLNIPQHIIPKPLKRN